MKLIPLSTQGSKHKGKYFAQVDDNDFEWISQWRWRAIKRKNTIYAQRVVRDTEKNTKVALQMHRVILGITDPSIIIDHKDRDGLNCQRCNIRIATRTQNACNSRKDIGGSKYIGVFWKTSERKWVARVSFNKKRYYVGRFDDEITAAKARDIKASELHGEFANLNFPDL